MVIKKPYAFLIKHFRLIHGLLFGLLLFLTSQSISIYSFFNDYATNHTYLNQANLASIYITPLMYIVTIVLILGTFIVYFILSVKEKSNRFYLASILYYIVLIAFFIYYKSVFAGLEEKVLDVESVRLLRDISLIMLIPQIIFLFILLGRTLGFNIKQFEFKKDLEELEIDVSDSEEVELTLGNDTYKVARFFRKLLRLTKYFLIENKLFVIASSSLLILALSIFIYSKINVYQESYGEDEDLQTTFLWFNVKESFITDSDLNNIVINKDKHYVLVNVSVTNKRNIAYNINRDTFKLRVNNDLIMPMYSLSNKFYDLGTTFEPCEIKGGDTKDFIVTFEVDDQYIEKEFLFKIKNYTINSNGNANYYKDIIIRPIDLNVSVDKGTFKLPNKIDLKDSLLKNSTLEIEKFDIADKFKEPFKYTINNVEKEGIYSVLPSATNKGSVTILKLKARLTLDKEVYQNKLIKQPADLFGMYGLLRYRYQGNYINVKLNKINVDYDKQTYSYLEIPKEVLEGTKIDLIILIRGVKYTINLK